ncbi:MULTISPECIES: YciI family protein [Streptomyces]|uniref:DGPF domain protein n=1 Tax=Streptomyces viridochromogenes TaxID=1938 RepID=A0A0L8JJ91_STRVR|nr:MULTISPECIES: YciI family protein [Streptomyces]KOG13683.1 DGPF domain protein [Streptomyces viridochromogenes]
MKYLVMVKGSQADYEGMVGRGSAGSPAWNKEQLQAMFDHMNKINEELTSTGEMLDAQGLSAPSTTRFVTVDADGEPVVTDGPYAETKEVLAGYWLLDCPSLDRVTEIAAQVARCPVPPGSPDYPVAIRPVDETGPSQD